jgi:hypothetical protein
MKKRFNEFRKKYWTVRRKKEPWAEFRHRVEVEQEIEKFLCMVKARTYFGLVPLYHENNRTEIITEALTKLSDLVLFEPSVKQLHGQPVTARTREFLVAFLHSKNTAVLSDWSIYKSPSLYPLYTYGIRFIYPIVTARYKILWYLSNYKSTTVVLPRDHVGGGGGVLRIIVEFVI